MELDKPSRETIERKINSAIFQRVEDVVDDDYPQVLIANILGTLTWIIWCWYHAWCDSGKGEL